MLSENGNCVGPFDRSDTRSTLRSLSMEKRILEVYCGGESGIPANCGPRPDAIKSGVEPIDKVDCAASRRPCALGEVFDG
jgi:hypothetical protein